LDKKLNHEDRFEGLLIAFLTQGLLGSRFVGLKCLERKVGVTFSTVKLAELIKVARLDSYYCKDYSVLGIKELGWNFSFFIWL
jgi:hypothetical protein